MSTGLAEASTTTKPIALTVKPSARATLPLESLKAGKLVGVDSNGKVALADGLTVKAIGFVVVDASANPVDNYPAVASKKLAVTLGDCVVETDQIEASVNITAGQLVYASATASNVGTLTNVQPTGSGDEVGSPIGVALTSCTAQIRTIQIAKF